MTPRNNRFLDLLRSPARTAMIIAHRGDSFHAPENTLEAARLGLEAGADAWELDVQLTRDGVPVVLHDESLLRTTDIVARFAGDPRGTDGFRVSDFDLDEVRSLDAGAWFVANDGGYRSARDFGTLGQLDPATVARYRSDTARVPTLEEALAFTRERNWLVNIEIKSFPDRPPGLVDRVMATIEATDTSDCVLLSSFDHEAVVAADRPGRRYGLGLLLWTPIHRLAEYAARLVGADTVHLSAEILGSEGVAYRRQRDARMLRHEIVAALRTSRLPTLVYTVNPQGGGMLAQHLVEIGVNGLFTDDPAGIQVG